MEVSVLNVDDNSDTREREHMRGRKIELFFSKGETEKIISTLVGRIVGMVLGHFDGIRKS